MEWGYRHTQISDIHSQIALTFEHVAGFGLSSVQRARSVADEKKIEEEEEEEKEESR